MSLFQFLRVDVGNAMSAVGQQSNITTSVMDQIKSYVPKVQSAWIGGDADEFAADVARKVIPAIMELIAAIGGLNLNLTKATDIVDRADQQCKSAVNQLSDVFARI